MQEAAIHFCSANVSCLLFVIFVVISFSLFLTIFLENFYSFLVALVILAVCGCRYHIRDSGQSVLFGHYCPTFVAWNV